MYVCRMMGPGSLICTYLGEFIGVKYRSLSVVILGGFYTVSWMVLPSVAFAILPLEFKSVFTLQQIAN